MQPYATASEPSPLNGNRPVVNGNQPVVNGNQPVVNGKNSFFTEYRKPILYSIALVAAGLFIAVSVRGKYSWYDHGKVGTKKKKSKKDKKNKKNKKNKKETRSVWVKAADTLKKKPKKGKKGSKVKPAGKCPAGCVAAGMEKKKVPNLSKTSFDPALTNKKPKIEPANKM